MIRHLRLGYQPLFRKCARAGPESLAEIEPYGVFTQASFLSYKPGDPYEV